MGDFALQAQQGEVRAIFVPAAAAAGRPGRGRPRQRAARVGLAVAGESRRRGQRRSSPGRARSAIRRRFALEDVALTVRGSSDLIVEALRDCWMRRDRARSRQRRPQAESQPASRVHLPRERDEERRPRGAVFAGECRRSRVWSLAVRGGPALAGPTRGPADPIVVNDWTAQRARRHASAIRLSLDYYVWQEPGQLVTRSADFQVAAIVPIAGLAADRDLAPVYPGITEAKSLANWDPPFPIDLRRIGRRDEDILGPLSHDAEGVHFHSKRDSGCGSRASATGSSYAHGVGCRCSRDRFATALRARINPVGVWSHRAARARAGTPRGPRRHGFRRVSSPTSASFWSRPRCCWRRCSSGSRWSSGRARPDCCAPSAIGPARVRRLFLAEGFVLACARRGRRHRRRDRLRRADDGRTADVVVGRGRHDVADAARDGGVARRRCGGCGDRGDGVHLVDAAALVADLERSLLAGQCGANRLSRPAALRRAARRSRSVAHAQSSSLARSSSPASPDGLDRHGGVLRIRDAAPRRRLVRRRGDPPPAATYSRSTAPAGGARGTHRPAQCRRPARPQHSGDWRDRVRHVPARRRRRLPARGAGRRAIGTRAPAAISCSSICCCRSSTIPTVATVTRRSGLPMGDPVRIDPFRVLPGDDASCLNSV